MAQLRSIKRQEQGVFPRYLGGEITVPPGLRRHAVYFGFWYYGLSTWIGTGGWVGYPKIQAFRTGRLLWEIGGIDDSSAYDTPEDGNPQIRGFWPWYRQSRRANTGASVWADAYSENIPAPSGPDGLVVPFGYVDGSTYVVFLEMLPIVIVEDCDQVVFTPAISPPLASNWAHGSFIGVKSD